MIPSQVKKAFIFSCFFIALAICLFLTFAKIWGEQLLVKDWYRQEVVFSGEMTISEFGRVNRLQNPILKSVFGLRSAEALNKRLKDVNLTQEEILNRVNKKLLVKGKMGGAEYKSGVVLMTSS